DQEIAAVAGETIDSVQKAYDRFEYSKALESVWALISAVDKFIVQRAPWKLARQNDDQSTELLNSTLDTAAEAVRVATAVLYPVLPQSARKIWSQLGMPEPLDRVRFDSLKWGGLQTGQKIGEVAAVFPRIEAKDAIAKMRALEETATAEQAAMMGKTA